MSNTRSTRGIPPRPPTNDGTDHDDQQRSGVQPPSRQMKQTSASDRLSGKNLGLHATGVQTTSLQKPPPSPPVTITKAPAIEPLQTDNDRATGYLSQSMPISLESAVQRPATASQVQANRLRARYLHTLRIPPPRTVDIPMSTAGPDTQRSGGGGPSSNNHHGGMAASMSGTGSSNLGSLGARLHREQQQNSWSSRKPPQKTHSQPVQIQTRDPDTIPGFWDKRAARSTSRRRHTTGGSPSGSYRRLASSRDSHDSLESPRQVPLSGDPSSIPSSIQDGRSSGSGTYLTAAAVSRTRRTTKEMLRGGLLSEGSSNEAKVGGGKEKRPGAGAGDSSSESSGARRPGNVVGQMRHTDSELDMEALMFTDEVPSSPGASASGGGWRGSRNHSRSHSHRSSSVSDSDTDTGHSSSDAAGSRSGYSSGGGALQFMQRERMRRHSSVDTWGGERMEEEDEVLDSPVSPGRLDLEGARGFVPPHMMTEDQRGCFSLGYEKRFRPKPKEM